MLTGNCLNKGRSWLSREWIRLLALAEVLVLAVMLRNYFDKINSLISYQFDREQIAGFTQEDFTGCFGGTIDESYASGLYDVIPDMMLQKGYYKYSVSYESTSQGSFCWPHSYVEYFDAIDQGVTYFEDGQHNNSSGFWLNVDLNVALRLFYSGTGSATITGFSIEETPYMANINLFQSVSMLIVLNILIWIAINAKKGKIAVETKYVFGALVTISILASYPLFIENSMNGHDFYFHLTRIEGIKEGLLSGQFPVRINPVFYNGYGYANSILYGEILLYIPALLMLVGFPLTTCYNLFVMMINVLTCFGCYYCFKRMFCNQTIAVTLSFLYTLSPYRLMDVYLRSAVGEYSAMMFLPFVVYGMYRIYTEDINSRQYRWSFVTLVFGLTGIIQTHVLTGEMTGAMILAACVLLLPLTLQRKRFGALLKTVLFTAGVNAWFLVPFIDFSLTQDIKVFRAPSTSLVQTTGTHITQLIGLFSEYQWENLDGLDGIANEMPLVLGTALMLGMILCAVMVSGEKGKGAVKKQACFFLGLSVLAIWMSTIYFPWDRISTTFSQLRTMVASIQFVWRFLAIATVLAVIVTGYGLYLLWEKEEKQLGITAVTVLCLLTGMSGMYFMEECIDNLTPVTLDNLGAMDTAETAAGGEYVLCTEEWEVVTGIFEPRAHEGVVVGEYSKQGTNITFTVENNETDSYVLLPLLNYKGYQVTSTDNVITNDNLSTGEAAEVRIDIPAGYSGQIHVRYQGMWYWRIAEVISLICAAYLAVMANGVDIRAARKSRKKVSDDMECKKIVLS